MSRVPVLLSFAEFDLNAAEDLVRTYTCERIERPDIRRTGKGPPYMDLIGEHPGQTTTLPYGLCLGTRLIKEMLREAEQDEAAAELQRGRCERGPPADLDVLQRTIAELPRIPSHAAVFLDRYSGFEIAGQQGCGDLTLNGWNFAYVNCDFGRTPRELVCLPQEPVEYRTHSCLVKWKAVENAIGRMTIGDVRFHRNYVRDPNEMTWIRFGDRWLPRRDAIDFAISNQQATRGGQLVPVVTICHKYGDLRHLLFMPKLNPEVPLYSCEPPKPNGTYCPRDYFNVSQHGDIWLDEEALLGDQTRNLVRATLSGPTFLKFPPGATEGRLRGALRLAGYRDVLSALDPLATGTWRFVRRGPQEVVLEIYYKHNTYGWTMVGLTQDNRRLLCLARQETPGRTGYTLEQAAEILLQAGAGSALLVDEVFDVFQSLRTNVGRMTQMVPVNRRRLRATSVLARPAYRQGAVLNSPAPDVPRFPAQRGPNLPCGDLRDDRLPPRDQGPEGTSVGFAAAALRELMLWHADPDLLSPTYGHRCCKEVDGILGDETYRRLAVRLLLERGVCPEDAWAYQPRTTAPPKDGDTHASPFRVGRFVRLDDPNPDLTRGNLRYWLHHKGPYVAAVLVHDGWFKAEVGQTRRIRKPTQTQRRVDYHSICVVGYDDEVGSFSFKNSWGRTGEHRATTICRTSIWDPVSQKLRVFTIVSPRRGRGEQKNRRSHFVEERDRT